MKKRKRFHPKRPKAAKRKHKNPAAGVALPPEVMEQLARDCTAFFIGRAIMAFAEHGAAYPRRPFDVGPFDA